jgi:hypothetical protein
VIGLEDRVETLEEVFAQFMRETSQILAANRENIAEIRASNARTDHQLLIMQQRADKDRQQAEKDRQQLIQMQQQADKDRQQADKDRQQADKDRQQAEKERKEFNRKLAEITDSQGLMIENMVWPNLKRIATEVFAGVPSEMEGIRIKRRKRGDAGRQKEIDLLAAAPAPGPVLVCEAKSKPSSEKTREFLDSLVDFPEYFPEYADRRIIPMVASIAFDPSLLEFMTRQGVLALGFGDETMEILNPEVVTTA